MDFGVLEFLIYDVGQLNGTRGVLMYFVDSYRSTVNGQGKDRGKLISRALRAIRCDGRYDGTIIRECGSSIVCIPVCHSQASRGHPSHHIPNHLSRINPPLLQWYPVLHPPTRAPIPPSLRPTTFQPASRVERLSPRYLWQRSLDTKHNRALLQLSLRESSHPSAPINSACIACLWTFAGWLTERSIPL